jgi:hypothetical protein
MSQCDERPGPFCIADSFESLRANVTACGTVHLLPGVYSVASPLILGTSPTRCIMGENVTLSGSGRERVLDIQARTASSRPPIELRGLTITGGYAHDQGAGLYVALTKAKLTNVTISDNHAEQGGGGLFVSNHAEIVLTGCSVLRNTVTFNGVGSGAGLYIEAQTLVYVEDVRHRDRTQDGRMASHELLTSDRSPHISLSSRTTRSLTQALPDARLRTLTKLRELVEVSTWTT